MQVELKISFSKEEILAMCLEKCQHIETAVPGRFEAHLHYTDTVICTFIPKTEDEAEEARMVRNAAVAEPLRSIVNAVSAGLSTEGAPF